MPRLTSISFTTSPRLPGMHGSPLSFDLPVKSGPLTGWKVALRADKLLFRSPPGWQPGDRPFQRRTEETGTDVVMYEVPRAGAVLVWTWAEGETPHEVVEWDEDGPRLEAAAPEKRAVELSPAEIAERALAERRVPAKPKARKASTEEPTS